MARCNGGQAQKWLEEPLRELGEWIRSNNEIAAENDRQANSAALLGPLKNFSQEAITYGKSERI